MARLQHRWGLGSVCVAAAALAASDIALAGPLDPPVGPPAPTGKTIGEVEPRTPVNSLPGDGLSNTILIGESGSYYLTNHIVGQAGLHGIVVALPPGETGAVSIDLNGFTMRGVPGSGDAIRVEGEPPVRMEIRNGTIHGWDGAGISSATTSPQSNMDITNVHTDAVLIGLLLPDVQKVREAASRHTNSASDGVVVGDDAIITDTVIEGSGGVGLTVGEHVVLKSSTVQKNAGGAIVGGEGGKMDSVIIEGAVMVGAYWNVEHSTFVLDLDSAAFQPIRFNDGLHQLEHNKFAIHGTNTTALPAIMLAGDSNAFRHNDILSVDPPPTAPMLSLRTPSAYADLNGRRCDFQGNTFRNLLPGTEAMLVNGEAHVIQGNTFIGPSAGSIAGILLQGDGCYVGGSLFMRLGPTGVAINDSGAGNIVAPMVTSSALGGNGNPDRNLVLP